MEIVTIVILIVLVLFARKIHNHVIEIFQYFDRQDEMCDTLHPAYSKEHIRGQFRMVQLADEEYLSAFNEYDAATEATDSTPEELEELEDLEYLEDSFIMILQ